MFEISTFSKSQHFQNVRNLNIFKMFEISKCSKSQHFQNVPNLNIFKMFEISTFSQCSKSEHFQNVRPKHFWKLQQMRPHGSFNRFWNFEGQMETSYVHLDYDWEFNDSSMAKTTWNVTPANVSGGLPLPTNPSDRPRRARRRRSAA